MQCTECAFGFYLTPEGYCVSFINLITTIPNCQRYFFSIRNMAFSLYYIRDEESFGVYIHTYSEDFDMPNYRVGISEILSEGKKQFNSKCLECEINYFLDYNGNCEKPNNNKCTFNSIIQNYDNLRQSCYFFCSESDNVLVILKLKVNNNNEFIELSIRNFSFNYYKEFIDNFGDSNNIKACLKNTGEGGEYAPKHLKNCLEAYFYPDNNTYICIKCLTDYSLDNNNLCKDKLNIRNGGTEFLPIYYGIDKNNFVHNFTLVIYENNEKEYIEAKGDLEGCVEAKADTKYINNIYNCTKSSFMYTPYFSKFFGRIICQNIKAKIIRKFHFL